MFLHMSIEENLLETDLQWLFKRSCFVLSHGGLLSADLAFQYRKKPNRQRALEALTAPRDRLGLQRGRKQFHALSARHKGGLRKPQRERQRHWKRFNERNNGCTRVCVLCKTAVKRRLGFVISKPRLKEFAEKQPKCSLYRGMVNGFFHRNDYCK